MQINGIDISTYGVTTYNRDIQTAEVVTYDDWLRNAANPTFVGQKEYFKKILITFVLKASTEQAVLENISNLIKLLEKSTILFDNLSFYYDCILTTSKITRYVPGTQQKLEVELKSGYAYKTALTNTISSVTTLAINVPGNLATPAIVTVTVPIATISLTINGLGRTITINNLHANTPVTIDGELCVVTENGVNKFAEIDMWGFPVLNPGANTITLSSANCTVSINYKPKYI